MTLLKVPGSKHKELTKRGKVLHEEHVKNLKDTGVRFQNAKNAHNTSYMNNNIKRRLIFYQ